VLSIFFLIALLLLATLLAAAILTFAAWWLNSARARFGLAFFASLLINVVNILGAVAYLLLPKEQSTVRAVAIIFIFVTEVVAIFYILQRVFQLSRLRTGGMLIANFAGAAIIYILMVCVAKPLILEAFVIPTRSMQPTLDQNDRFIVNKVIAPHRWDIVAYWGKLRAAKT
jgi:hypothetical protein